MLKEVHIFSTTKQKPFFFSFFVCLKSMDCGYAKTLAFLFPFYKSVEFFFFFLREYMCLKIAYKSE